MHHINRTSQLQNHASHSKLIILSLEARGTQTYYNFHSSDNKHADMIIHVDSFSVWFIPNFGI